MVLTVVVAEAVAAIREADGRIWFSLSTRLLISAAAVRTAVGSSLSSTASSSSSMSDSEPSADFCTFSTMRLAGPPRLFFRPRPRLLPPPSLNAPLRVRVEAVPVEELDDKEDENDDEEEAVEEEEEEGKEREREEDKDEGMSADDARVEPVLQLLLVLMLVMVVAAAVLVAALDRITVPEVLMPSRRAAPLLALKYSFCVVSSRGSRLEATAEDEEEKEEEDDEEEEDNGEYAAPG